MIAGVLVGGAATRMGGRPKGLLRAPDGRTIVERWRAMLDELRIPLVLVGASAAYRRFDLEAIADAPSGVGPLGGLCALLAHAGGGRAIALGCDMPLVSPALLERLAHAPGDAPVVSPRRGPTWEPLFARYDAPRVLPMARRRASAGAHSLQGLLDEAGAAELPLTGDERAQLRDWDSPSDVTS